MRPIDFDDAREMVAWEPVERALHTLTRALKKEKTLLRLAAHEQWERHWRTRLACWLRSRADDIELPEPRLLMS